jgi:hypothetical protein
MRRVEIQLKDNDRETLKATCSSGVAPVRVLQRAQILLSLDQGILDQQIAVVLQVERTRIWRVRMRYLEQRLKGALHDQPRSGRPTEYGDLAEAELVALAQLPEQVLRHRGIREFIGAMFLSGLL